MKCPVEGADIIGEINSILDSNLSFESIWAEVKGYPAVQEYIGDCLADAKKELDVSDDDIDADPALARRVEARAIGCAMDKVVDTISELPGLLAKLAGDRVVYRAMAVDDIGSFIDQVKRTGRTTKGCIGASWAFDERHAVVFYAQSATRNEYVLVARIELADIDAFGTVSSYVIFGCEGDRENEVVLNEGSEILLVEMHNRDSGERYPVNAEICT